jgi:hypothetical protein
MMLHKKLYVLIFIFKIINCFSISFIQNGDTLPSFLNPVQGGYSLSVGIWNQAEPIFAEIVKSDGTTIQINSNYKSWDPATQTASSTLKSVRGTVLVFDDILSLASDGLLLNRTVTVQAVGKGEV